MLSSTDVNFKTQFGFSSLFNLATLVVRRGRKVTVLVCNQEGRAASLIKY